MSQGGPLPVRQHVLSKAARLRLTRTEILTRRLKPTQQTCHFVSFLLLDGLVVQSLEEHVQHQDVVPAKEGVCPSESKIRWLLDRQYNQQQETQAVCGRRTHSCLSPSFTGLEGQCGQQSCSGVSAAVMIPHWSSLCCCFSVWMCFLGMLSFPPHLIN